MQPQLESTLTPQQAASADWEVIVVGAGIAGSITALGLARLGRRVLLVERSRLPREKVCGACLSADAVAGLRRAGVWPAVEALGGWPLSRYSLRAGGRQVSFELPGGHAVSRAALDRALAASAIDAGAAYLDQTAVRFSGEAEPAGRRILLDRRGHRYSATIVVVSAGLSSPGDGGTARDEWQVVRDSRIGLGARWRASSRWAGGEDAGCVGAGLDCRASDALRPGVIYMAAGRAGYVGLVRTEGDQVNLAAAVDRSAVQQASPREVCRELLAGCGWDFSGVLREVDFCGTRPLSRVRPVAGGRRVFFVGDASGYIEPFTGEGMAWAVRGAMGLVPLVDEAVQCWSDALPEVWTNSLRALLGTQQRRCRWLARGLRHPWLVRGAVETLASFPTLGRFAVQNIQRERSFDLLNCRPWDCGSHASGDAA